jgi:hypothetical protein
MKQTTGRMVLGRLIFYFGIILLAGGVLWFENYLQNIPTFIAVGTIPDKAVDAFLEMNRLLTTLGTSLLGAMALLLFSGFRGRACSREIWAAVAGAVSVGLSIYYGYAACQTVTSMLASGVFDPHARPLLANQNAHFYTFLAGVIFFADFVYQNMKTEDTDEQSPAVTSA